MIPLDIELLKRTLRKYGGLHDWRQCPTLTLSLHRKESCKDFAPEQEPKPQPLEVAHYRMERGWVGLRRAARIVASVPGTDLQNVIVDVWFAK